MGMKLLNDLVKKPKKEENKIFLISFYVMKTFNFHDTTFLFPLWRPSTGKGS